MRSLAIAFVLLSLPAFAADAPKKTEELGIHVEMPFLIAPMSSADGKLVGYAYISSKLVSASPSASVEIRDKLAFIQDAFVRDVNAAPIGKANDPKSVDMALLSQRLVADARRVVGAAKVANIVFKQVQFAPIHSDGATDAVVAPTAQAAPAKTAASKP